MKKLTLLFILFSITLFAQESFVIKNVRLFDGEKVHDKTSVLVSNGKIAEVAKKIKGNYQTIDCTDKILIPALTNAHVHAWMSNNLQEAAKAGVLNVLDMHGVEVAQTMMKAYKDSTNYANYFVAGAAATAPGGHGTQYGFPTATLTKPEEAEKFISDRVKAGADYIKIIVEPWRKTLSHETVKVLIDEAHKQEKIAVVHISKVADAYKVLNNNADGIVHIWWDKPMTDEQLTALAKNKKFFVIPTILTTHKVFGPMKEKNPKAQIMQLAEIQKEVKRLYEAGIPVLAGTDPPNAGINYGTDLYTELKYIVEAGIPAKEALKNATSVVATSFGLKNRGMIAKDYFADMILIDGNPLENIEDLNKINTVFKAGKKVKR